MRLAIGFGVFVLAGLLVAPVAAQGKVSFAQAVRVAGPSVVNIFAATTVRPLEDVPLGVNLAPPVQQRLQRSLGSGVIVSTNGKVVTTLHVIQNAQAVQVVTHDGQEYQAKLVASDPKLDLAVLQLKLPQGVTLPVAKFADSDQLQVGDLVLAVGNPYGLGQSISLGVVSAVARSQVALNPYAQFIQTDASINPGNSGGALIDSTGAVVGLNTAVFNGPGGSKNPAQGLGFVIPANVVRTVVSDLVTTGRVVRPWLGAEGQGITYDTMQELNLPDNDGVLITAVLPGSPAAAAGLQRGDVLRSLNGVKVQDAASLNQSIITLPGLLNKAVPLGIWRGGKAITLQATLRALPPRREAERAVVTGYNPLGGLTVEPLGPALNSELGLPLTTQGVAVLALPQQPLAAFDQRFQPGDIVVQVNGQPTPTVRALQGALATSRRAWEVRFQRGGEVRLIKF
ncbi:MAG: trypsin-like peptidase domain-containing protein [Alphaproteobacteria bacterium]|nr:trypsin-like peptidase domain-containing protein [Alphaproteobacteria bacterium]